MTWLRRWALPGILAAILAWGLVIGGGTGDRAIDLGNRIRCPKCQAESVSESQVPTAITMARIIREKVDAGWSDQQILDFFTARYGPSVLMDPPADVSGIILWSVPVAGIIAGGLILARSQRRRKSEPESSEKVPEKVESSPPALKTLGIVVGGAVAVTASAFLLGQVLQPVADTAVVSGDITPNLDEISNETLESTIAEFKATGVIPTSQLNAMELALAERYFEEQQFSPATDHFQAVLLNEPLPSQASEALGRMGWILFVNNEAETAEVAYQRALEALPTNSEAAYFYAILLVDAERGAEAGPLLAQVAESPTLPPDVLEHVQQLLDQIGSS